MKSLRDQCKCWCGGLKVVKSSS